ncbi:MAG: sulfite exporter TauE/SafE family protein [Clostridiales bacterium]|jgi:uncharacterized membrane protein YfcA|nr:sulfite exporter TauE/SafE family protein [Clostridiales bacterium]
MAVTTEMLLVVCPLVFLASLIDSIGGGGGLISLPAYLLAGLPPKLAAGSNKFSASFGTLVATIRYWRSKKILPVAALLAVAGAFPGAYAGAEVLKRIGDGTVRMIMLIAIPLVAVLFAFKRNTPVEPKPMTRRRHAACFFIGLGCGFYDGIFGPGTGTILIMLFTWLAGMDMVTASGTSKPVNLASNAAAVTSMLLGGHVLFALAIPAMICSVVGGFVGSKLALKVGARLIRFVMLGVLVLLVAKLAYEWLVAA